MKNQLFMIEAFKIYFDKVKGLDLNDATEHTLRGALENLLNSTAQVSNAHIKVIHEPKKDKSGKGAPDFKFKINEAILGYLENKKIEENLDQILKSAQITKYKQLSGNIIITNYLEWIWLRDGIILARETLCYQNDVGNRKAKLDPEKAEKVGKLIEHFYSTPPKKIGSAKELALALATRCHDLRDVLLEELLRQQREHQEERLWGLYSIFKKEVFHELEVKEFADAFAQTLAYGLFLARLNMEDKGNKLTLDNAKKYIPAGFELIRELVNFLDELEKDQYLLAKQPIDEILSIMNTLDLSAIHEDLAFTKQQGKLFKDMEEERQLFAKDPYVYFYEDFLNAYDAAMRKRRGVYYTPPPVVNFIVRAINDILKDTFGIVQGLADRKKVTALDFATGTGTFLIEILQQIFETVPDGVRDQVIQEHVLKNLYGFEYLIAPYTIAHLKLSQFLHDKGYDLKPKERLQIYLTNTLEPISPQVNWLLPALSREVKQAQEVKDKPILVITGNPPYSGKSKNNGEWICKLIETYKNIDGQPLGERNLKWLQNDYVKFIRFAQKKMDEVDEGIVGIITSHSYLDNQNTRGMRYSLSKSFDQIYIINLHGNYERREKMPGGGKDENVFEIKEGVAITLLIKKKGVPKKIGYFDIWGNRIAKYRECLEKGIANIDWNMLNPIAPYYLFVPQKIESREDYQFGYALKDIFRDDEIGIGLCSKKDHVAIQFSESQLNVVYNDFLSMSEVELRRKYKTGDDKDEWNIAAARQDIKAHGRFVATPLLYAPYDQRLTIYSSKSKGLLSRPSYKILRHLLFENIGLITTRATKDNWSCLVSNTIIGHKSASRYDGSYIAPLYLYNTSKDTKPTDTLFKEADLFDGKERIENFAPAFRKFVDDKYGKHYG